MYQQYSIPLPLQFTVDVLKVKTRIILVPYRIIKQKHLLQCVYILCIIVQQVCDHGMVTIVTLYTPYHIVGLQHS